MALSDDLRKRVVEAVVLGGLSRNAAGRRFGVSIASAVRWVTRYKATGQISPSPSGGDRRSGRIEAQRDYLLGLIRRTPDITLLEIQERLIQNCGERFSVSVLWRFFDRHGVTLKKDRARRGAAAPGRFGASPELVRLPTRSRSRQTHLRRRDRRFCRFQRSRPSITG
jgi:transposase